MKNAFYLNYHFNKARSYSSRSIEKQNFLYDLDLYCHESYTSVIAETAGYELTRLPPYCCIFNPIELIWHEVKSNIRTHKNTPTLNSSITERIKMKVENVTVKNWRYYTEYVKKFDGCV